MVVLRRFGLAIFSSLFGVLLFATALDIGFVRTASHPATVKKLLADSGVYKTVVPSLLQQTPTISTGLGDFATSDPAVQAAASQAFSPQDVQKQVEAAIDNIYQWLDGKIAQPNFNIGLQANQTGFADKLSAYVADQLGRLPSCSAAQSLAIARAGGFDATHATCLPRGVAPTAAAEQVKKNLLANQAALSQAKLTAADIKNPNKNETVFQGKLKDAPRYYRDAKKTPWILAILTILTGVAVVFLSGSRPAGLRHIGINLAVVGVIMLLFAWLLNWGINRKLLPTIPVDNQLLQSGVRKLVTDLTKLIDRNYWFFGGLYIVLGAGCLTAAEIWRRRQPTVAGVRPPSQPASKGQKPTLNSGL
jgi:hypothetical protein